MGHMFKITLGYKLMGRLQTPHSDANINIHGLVAKKAKSRKKPPPQNTIYEAFYFLL